MVDPYNPTPIGPGDFRCSDADRLATAELLNEAFADGRLSIDEHSERIDAVWQAKTFNDLTPITLDLGIAGRPAVPRLPANHTQDEPPLPALADHPEDSATLSSFLSATRRENNWVVPRNLNLVAVLGDIELDLRTALFSSHTTKIDVHLTLGSVKLFIPDGVSVQDNSVKIFADNKTKGVAAAVPGAPIIVITGSIILGDLTVIGPKHRSWHRRLTR